MKKNIDKTVRVSEQIHWELQQLWASDLLCFDHSAMKAVIVAQEMNLPKAAEWIKSHYSDYERGYNSGIWGLDTGKKFDGNVICRRVGAYALTNVPRSVIQGSPQGHEWGYSGSGPHDLALDILNWFRPPNGSDLPLSSTLRDRVDCFQGYCSALAWRLRHPFCMEFIATMQKEGGEITAEAIEKWIVAAASLCNWAEEI